MKIKQLYTSCLAEAAYYIESNGEAAIIDPLRETAPYLELLQQNGAQLKYIFETHFHADFVSGHVDLAHETGASIVYGPTAQAYFDIHVAKDEEVFILGDIRIKLLHTPGHTMESSSFLLFDEDGKEHALFTGDTLFIGDVGRPDLAVKSDLSREDLAGLLYDSLHQKIMPLSDDIVIYPGHGAGSQCGKNLSTETVDTLGHQKQVNYALKAPTKNAFIQQVTEGILPPPQYFPKNAVLNKSGYERFDVVMERSHKGLNAEEFEAAMKQGGLVIDTRPPSEVIKGYIPGAITIGLNGSFAVWVGTLVEQLDQPLLIVAEDQRIKEVITRLSRVGYDQVIGYLEGGIATWQKADKPMVTVPTIDANELKQAPDGIQLLDVRRPAEFDAAHVEGAKNYPLDYLMHPPAELDLDATLYVYCKSGYRSVVAASLFRKHGFKQLVNINGGIDAIAQTETPLTAAICAS